MHTLIEQATESARCQDWAAARDSYRAAIQTDPFSWEAAESLYPRVMLKMALAFALAGDPDAYAQLGTHSKDLDDNLDQDFARIVMLPGAENVFGRMSLTLDARRIAQEPESEGVRHAPEWNTVLLALVDFGEGKPEAASRALAQAQSAYNLSCAGVAFAYEARLRAQQGDEEGAQCCRDQAAQNLEQLRQSHGDDWGKYWFEIAWLQLVLDSPW